MVNQQGLLNLSTVDPMPGEQDFVIFMQQNQERVYRLALYLLGNAEEARDAAQESFVKAWKKFETLRSETGRAWITKITVNLCLDWLRRRKFRNDFPESESEIQEDFEYRLPDPNPDPLEQCLSAEMQAKVTEAISKLPVAYRSVVILRDLEGLGYQEIADVLNTKISKVKSNLFRGRRKLKEILRPFFIDIDYPEAGEAKVEVNLAGTLFSLAAKAVGDEDPEASEFLASLKAIRVRIYDQAALGGKSFDEVLSFYKK